MPKLTGQPVIKKGWLVIISFLIAMPLPAQVPKPYVLVPAGVYTIGKKGHGLNPQRKVKIDSFYIAATETTNGQFAAFVTATGYITDAEKTARAMVFEPGLKEFQWLQDSTACWRYPNGRGRGGIEQKMDHPVTTISYTDAVAYCQWAGVRLPALDEWEIAARAGSTTDYFWGSDKTVVSRYANIWHSRNHLMSDTSDGYMYTAPVAQFSPNRWGLYDVYGNVFEFCEGRLPTDKAGSQIAHARGGSWWCSKNACNFFNSADIGRVNIHAAFSNQGFRVVLKDKSNISE